MKKIKTFLSLATAQKGLHEGQSGILKYTPMSADVIRSSQEGPPLGSRPMRERYQQPITKLDGVVVLLIDRK